MSADHELPENPYPGLRPFQADETHLFFGRDVQTAALLRRLQRSRFLAIVGTSGSGKSSLVRAGMLQGLYGGLVAGGSQWRVVDLRPGTHPIGNLAAALDRPGALRDEGCSADDSFTDATLRRSALGLVQAVREARLAPRERVLVLVDQFEELFRAIDGGGAQHVDDDAAAFVQLLLEAARQDELPIYVALTMRSDFLGECARFRDLPEAISDGQYLIPRLTRDQLREAITGPAAVHGVALTDRLVDRLLNDLGGNPDQLPILQHALMRTWNLWARDPARGRTLDLADYERIGGMAHALSRHADEVLASLGDAPVDAGVAPLRVAECLFKALAAIGPGGQEVRRFASVQAVADIAGVSPDAVIAVVEAFRAPGNSFLMPPVGEPLAAATDIDISHESLIRNWTMVRGWLAEEAESQRIYERVATTAALHAQGQAGLLRGPDLSRALAWRARQRPTAAWARRYAGDFGQAMDFIDDSQATARASEARAAGRRRLSLAALAISLLAVVTLLLIWVADNAAQRNHANWLATAAAERMAFSERLVGAYEEAQAAGREVSAETCRQLHDELESVYDTGALRPALEALCRLPETLASLGLLFEFSEDLARDGPFAADLPARVEGADDEIRAAALDLWRLTIVVRDARRAGNEPGPENRLLQFVDDMARLHAAYRETGHFDARQCAAHDGPGEVAEGYPALVHFAGWPCRSHTDLQAYAETSRLMFAGLLREAEVKLNREWGDWTWYEALDTLKQGMLDMQSPSLRDERQALVTLREAVNRRGQGTGVNAGDAASASPQVFEHPVHRAIAAKLLAPSGPQRLTCGEGQLLHAYATRPERSRDPSARPSVPECNPASPGTPRGSDADGAAAETQRLDAVGAELASFYASMGEQAQGHESTRIAQVVEDRGRIYGVSLLIVLSWPVWWGLRRWRLHQGRPVVATPGALRRALAAVFDSGIAVGIFMLVGFVGAALLDGFDEVPEWAFMLLTLLAAGAGWGYLLGSDALRLRYCRSLGKAAFDLRPVRADRVGDAGRITLRIAARRGALHTAVLTLLVAALFFGDLDFDASLEWLAGYAVLPLLLLFWLPMALARDGRTWGDRWSATRVIDAGSDTSYRADAPPRYLARPGPAAAYGGAGTVDAGA
jgi:hypothetical protein